MIFSKPSKKVLLLFFVTFWVCALLRILLRDKDFAIGISILFCGVLTIIWAISVHKRVTDTRLRRIMLGISSCLIILFIMQLLRYDFFYGNVAVRRYLWYGMYLPLIAQPMLCFFLAVCIHRPKDKPFSFFYYLLIGCGIVFALAVLTNDLHFCVKYFPGGVMDDNGEEKSGWLFYLINFFIYGLYALTYFIILKKDLRFVGRRYRWLPLVPLVVGFIYFCLYPLDIGPRIFGFRLWNISEISTFCIIGALEACVQVGMIPVNMGYETAFSASFIPAVILDDKGQVIYQTAAATYPFLENEDSKVMSHAICGGSIKWSVDIKQMRTLNQQIEEATQQIKTRNAYLAEENRIQQERAELETRNLMYDSLSQIVKPQLDLIDDLLDTEKESTEKILPKIAVLSAYIKRRSNMELLSETGQLSIVELASAVRESLDYMRLCEINTAITSIGVGTYPAKMIIAAYEHIQAIMEKSLDTLSDFVVTLRAEKERLIVRMMLKADDFVYQSNGFWQDDDCFSRKLTITKDKQDMLIVLTFTKGGGKK